MNNLQFLLTKLSEECAEIAQVASKTIQFGYRSKHPEKDETNLERLHSELDDLYAIVKMLNEQYAFDYIQNEENIAKKIARVNHYAEFSKNENLLHNDVPSNMTLKK